MRVLALFVLMAMHAGATLGDGLDWVKQGAPTLRAREMTRVLSDAAAKGLNPEDYRVPELRAGASAEEIAKFEAALSAAAMLYLSDVSSGRANPGLYGHPREDVEAMLREVLAAPDLGKALEQMEPPFEGYRRTLRALAEYRGLAGLDDGELLPSPAPGKKAGTPKVQAGDAYAGVPRLARLLRELGDLAPDAVVLETYGGVLVSGVKHFQSRHGLEADGVIGAATLKALNVPLSRRVLQLELTLERWRWVPHTFSRPPIVVNIPEFEVRALDDSLKTALEMKVVVGKAAKLQTPPFAAQLEQVIFRPYWNVPRSILRKDLLPEIAKDRSYLVKHEYEAVTVRGDVVTNGVVSDEVLAQLRSGVLGLRQIPGPKNALGLVKFVFPNPNDVYMHDTPALELFGRWRRDFSHGCIRLEHAEQMAAFVLRDEGWSDERIHAAMHGSETVRVNLRRPIPVLIVYGTAVVVDGEVHFFDDVYGLDEALDAEITNAGFGRRLRE